MSTEITVRPVMDVASHKDAIQAIQRVMSEVMIKGKHYGSVPGCGDKPVLLKPGAEKIMATFGIRPEVHEEQIPEANGHIRYRVKVRALSQAGTFLGEGIGECSTAEEKFCWERAAGQEHFDQTPESDRRKRWRKRGDSPWQELQVRTNPPDKANTVLKMAKKRALVDMVLTVTAASDIFDQDLDEDEPQDAAPAPIAPPQAKTNAEPKAEPQPAATEPPPADGPVSTGIVEHVSETPGSNACGPYTRYGVKVNGEWHSSFSDSIGEAARQAHENGATVTIVHKGDKYRTIETLNIVGATPF